MLKSFGRGFLVAALIFVLSAADALAQSRIRFARGANSTTVSGTISKNGDLRYTVRGAAGQRITVSVKSGNNYVFAGVEAVGQGRTVTGRLPYDADYIIELSNGGEATRYSMTVTIR